MQYLSLKQLNHKRCCPKGQNEQSKFHFFVIAQILFVSNWIYEILSLLGLVRYVALGSKRLETVASNRRAINSTKRFILPLRLKLSEQ